MLSDSKERRNKGPSIGPEKAGGYVAAIILIIIIIIITIAVVLTGQKLTI